MPRSAEGQAEPVAFSAPNARRKDGMKTGLCLLVLECSLFAPQESSAVLILISARIATDSANLGEPAAGEPGSETQRLFFARPNINVLFILADISHQISWQPLWLSALQMSSGCSGCELEFLVCVSLSLARNQMTAIKDPQMNGACNDTNERNKNDYKMEWPKKVR